LPRYPYIGETPFGRVARPHTRRNALSKGHLPLITRVIIHPPHYKHYGALYSATVEGEELPIVTGSRDPQSDVCRMLLARGFEGVVEFAREGVPHWDLRVLDLRQYATRRVSESQKGGLREVAFKPFEKENQPCRLS
jgi:hypothetical protein